MVSPKPAAADEEADDTAEEGDADADAPEPGPESEAGAGAEADEPEDPFAAAEEPEEEIDVDLADTNVGEPVTEADDTADTGGGGGDADPFDGVDDADTGPDAGPGAGAATGDAGGGGGAFDGSKSSYSGHEGGMGEGFGDPEEPLEDTIVNGAARLAVVGLPESFEAGGRVQSKQSLQTEFEEVFEEFRLGHYGSAVAREYLFVDEDVDPLWGFAASALACAAIVYWMRPDSDELLDSVGGGGDGGLLDTLDPRSADVDVEGSEV